MNNKSVPPQSEPYLYDDGGAAPVSMGVWVKAAWRRKWLMLSLLVLIMGAGVLFTYLEKPVYEATALMAFGGRPSGAFAAEAGEQVTYDFINAQISLMMRDATLGEIVRDPELGLPNSKMFRGETDLVQALKDRLKILLLKDTSVLSISVQGQDPKLVTAIANKIADYQRASVESRRDTDVRSGVSEYVKKMADMSSEMSAIDQSIWVRANSAGIAGLTFDEQQKSGNVIIAAFRRQSDLLTAQRSEARKQLDENNASLATAESQFKDQCTSLLQEAPPEAKPAAGNETPPPEAKPAAENKTPPPEAKPAAENKTPPPEAKPGAGNIAPPTAADTEKTSATAPTTPAAPAQPASPTAVAATITPAAAVAATATPAAAVTPASPALPAKPVPPKDKPATDTAGKPEPPAETIPMVTAAQLAALYQQQFKIEEEEAEQGAGNLPSAAMEKRHGEIMAQIEDLDRRHQFQYQRAQETDQERTAEQEKVAKQTERINDIEDALEARKLSLTAENYEQDFEVKALRERKATLEAECEADRAKLNAGLSHLEPRLLEEGQKIKDLDQAAAALHLLGLSRKIYRENYEKTQAALDAITGPLNDMLNSGVEHERLEQAYVKMEEWVREVKLALSRISVTVYEATEPTIPISPKWPINIALSGMLGIVTGLGVAMLLEFGRKTVKTPSDVTRSLGAPALGVVPHFRLLNFGDKVFSLDVLKNSHVVETFNEVRFHIYAATEGQPPRSVLVTSAAAEEGKTTIAMLLAHSLARSGKTVLLVDANLRWPYLHSVFHCDDKAGLVDVLRNGTDLRSCVRPTEVQNLSLMTAGAIGEDGLAWIQTERVTQFVRTACESFDHVILDGTSTIGVADARIMASSVDAVIYVVQAGRLNSTIVSRGVENLRQARANLLGVVLNNARYTKGDHYYYRKRAVIRKDALRRRAGDLRGRADDKPSESDGEGNNKA